MSAIRPSLLRPRLSSSVLAAASSRTASPLAAARPRFFHATSSAMTVHEFTSKADYDRAIKDNKVVIIDATAVWCGPCKMISPVLEKLSEDPAFQNVYFAKFDVDQVTDLSMELGVRAMPSFYVFEGGEKADSMVGANPRALETLVTKYAQQA